MFVRDIRSFPRSLKTLFANLSRAFRGNFPGLFSEVPAQFTCNLRALFVEALCAHCLRTLFAYFAHTVCVELEVFKFDQNGILASNPITAPPGSTQRADVANLLEVHPPAALDGKLARGWLPGSSLGV